MRFPQFILAASILVAATGARADVGAFASVASLDAGTRARLDSSVTVARTRDPDAFAAVRTIVARADAFDHEKRGRFYPMTPMLRGVSRSHAGAAMALLEPLIAPERFAMPQSPSARIALRAGLIEAAGDLKDPAAAAVFRTIVANGTEFFEVRAASEALGKLALDADVAMLAKLAIAPGPNQDAIVSGLGSCRRVAAAHALEAVALQRPTGMFGKHVLRSLSSMASAWALAANAAPALEAPAIRDIAGRASLALFVATTDPDVRAEASNTLVVIAAPDAPQWIADAKKSATPDVVTALDALAARLAQNPTTTRRSMR